MQSVSIEIDADDEDVSQRLITSGYAINVDADCDLDPVSDSGDQSPLFPVDNRRFKVLRITYVVDVLLSAFVFGPLVSIYWYCTWSFLDAYLLTTSLLISSVVASAVGLSILLPCYLFQIELQRFYDYLAGFGRFGKPCRFMTRVVYIYLVSISIVCQWRGLWNICDLYLFSDWISQLSLSVVALAYFSLTRSTRSLVATPFVLVRDNCLTPFTALENRHKRSTCLGVLKYAVDFVLTEMIECFALIIAWRGFGSFYQRYIFPLNTVDSILLSFSAGYGAYFLLASLQYSILKFANKRLFILRLIIEDLVNVMMFLSAVLIWKFYWNFIDFYVYSRTYALLLFLIGHFTVFSVSIPLQTAVLLGGPGSSGSDGGEFESKIYFQFDYFTSVLNPPEPVGEERAETDGDDEYDADEAARLLPDSNSSS